MLTEVRNRWASTAVRIAQTTPWTNVYGLARTLLAVGTMLTLLCSPIDAIFRPAAGMPMAPVCAPGTAFGFFCALRNHLELARWLAIAALAVVASGWRPRLTGIVHWWLSFSLFTSGMLVDGGDQATAVLSLILLPVTLLDSRRWHWEPADAAIGGPSARIIAYSALIAARLQMAGIYLHAAVGKMRVSEWADGTVMYYWLTDPSFGLLPGAKALIMPLLLHPFGVALLTWSTIVFEMLLFMAIVMERRWWKPLLIAGIVFHLGIAVCMGLVSFGFAMIGGLILYLRPVDRSFSFGHLIPSGVPMRVSALWRSSAVPSSTST